MAESLRDQLLKAGFAPAPEKQERPARRPKRPGAGARREATPTPAPVEPVAAPPVPEAAPAERPRNKKKKKKGLGSLADKSSPAYQQAMARAARLNPARPEPGAEASASEDLPFNFVHEGRIRCLYVKTAERDALADGRLAIVTGAGGYELVPAEQAERLLQASPERVVHRADDAGKGEDPEADHPVPDDLHW